MSEKPTLESVRIEAIPDDDPRLGDYLGTFSDEPGPENRTVDRRARGVQGRHEVRYFVANLGPEETGNPDSVEEDWERAEAYGRSWVMVGIRAVATIRAGGTAQTVKSSGLWGVESDADGDYLDSIAREELNELQEILADLGIDTDGLAAEWADGAPNRGTVDV